MVGLSHDGPLKGCSCSLVPLWLPHEPEPVASEAKGETPAPETGVSYELQ